MCAVAKGCFFLVYWADFHICIPRFVSVARVSLVIQNVAVIVCGGLLLILLELEQHITHKSVITMLEAFIIVIGSIADLSSIGTKIAVEKDWVVVIAGSDKELLASKYMLNCKQSYSFPQITCAK